jgi:GntR family transcriptional regulator
LNVKEQVRERPEETESDAVPAYKQIQKYLQELIAGPDYGPGDRIPSERALAEQLGRNRMTVRKAVEGLVAQGLLERHSTSGTRVPAPRVTRPIDSFSLSGFHRIVQAGGGTAASKLLHFEQGHASSKVASRLKLADGADVVTFRRLWTANDTPVCIETTHLPLSLVPDLAAEDLMAGGSLYDLFRDRYGIAGPIHGERELGIVDCSEMEGRLLDLLPGTPCLSLQMLVEDHNNRPIEFTRSINHPNLVVFKTVKVEI